MNKFQICWIIAGFILGCYSGMWLAALVKRNTNWTINLAIGFVGALIAYTIVK